MKTDRRGFLTCAGAAAALAVTGVPALAEPTKYEYFATYHIGMNPGTSWLFWPTTVGYTIPQPFGHVHELVMDAINYRKDMIQKTMGLDVDFVVEYLWDDVETNKLIGFRYEINDPELIRQHAGEIG